MKNEKQLSVAAVYSTKQEAAITRGMLAGYGIESFIDNSNSSSVYPLAFGALGNGEVRLYVADADLADAQRLITEHGD